MYEEGQTVRFIGSNGRMPMYGNGFTLGKEYVVGGAYYRRGSGRCSVVADNHGRPNGWCAEYFELVPQENPW